MIDLHSHVLPGLDDGARTLDDSLEIAAAAAGEGIEALAATPHVREDYPTSPEAMERALSEVRKGIAAAGIALDVLPGGELALDFLAGLTDAELRRFGLGGNPTYLLLEMPYHGWPLALADVAFRLRTRGFRSVLAHPERNSDVAADPERLRPLVEAGLIVQLTAASLDGRLGRVARETSLELLERNLGHLLASDAHTPDVREAGLAAAVASLDDEALATWLASDVPRAIVSGDPIPPRPARPQRRRRFRVPVPWRA